MKRIGYLFFLFCIQHHTYACGPSPQKVEKTVFINANVNKVWAIVGDFSTMYKWHPLIVNSLVEKSKNSDGSAADFRMLTLKDGGYILERRRETSRHEMKVGTVIEESSLPISNYSDAITVHKDPKSEGSIVTWIGRFNNQANKVEAPIGHDNVAAVQVVNKFYEIGLANLQSQLQQLAQ
jgi:hypothetical protein